MNSKDLIQIYWCITKRIQTIKHLIRMENEHGLTLSNYSNLELTFSYDGSYSKVDFSILDFKSKFINEIYWFDLKRSNESIIWSYLTIIFQIKSKHLIRCKKIFNSIQNSRNKPFGIGDGHLVTRLLGFFSLIEYMCT